MLGWCMVPVHDGRVMPWPWTKYNIILKLK
jgi:hypothetical protein